MAGEKFKVVARLGNAAAIPTLINGEIGYDVDTKTFRVGDDTSTPTKLATNKSTGLIEYLSTLTVKFGDIQLHTGKKIDGVDPSTMNQENGVVARIADGVFANRQVIGDPDYISVTNPDGVAGNITISLSENVIDLIGGPTSSAVRFTYGETFPTDENARPGQLHYLLTEELLYIRAKQADDTEFWLDFSSVVGGGSRTKRFYLQDTAPIDAVVGDEWYDDSINRLFMRMIEADNTFWMERTL